MTSFARRSLLAATVLLLFAAPTVAAERLGILDSLVSGYESNSAFWLLRLHPYAQVTFGLLATLEFAVSALFWGLRRHALDDLVASIFLKLMLLGLFYSFLLLFPTWLPLVVRGFEHAGQQASGSVAVSPSGVLDVGIQICGSMMLSSFGSFLVNPIGNLLSSLAILGVFASFALIAAQLVLVLVESYIVLSSGIFFLAFSGSRFTAGLTDSFFTYALRVGIKIFLLYILTAVGLDVATTWNGLIGRPLLEQLTLRPAFEVLASSLIFALLVWRIPSSIANHLTGNLSLRLADAHRG